MIEAFPVLLATLLALIATSCVVLVVAYLLVARRLTRRMRETINEMESVVATSLDALRSLEMQSAEPSLIPPMQIRLLPINRTAMPEGDLFGRIDDWMVGHRFQFAGCFRVTPGGERLQVYLCENHLLVAAIRIPLGVTGHYVEFCCQLESGGYTGVANPPASSIQLPPDAVGQFFEGSLEDSFELLDQMLESAQRLCSEHTASQTLPQDIPAFFENAHWDEMKVRISDGGVSEMEIRESFSIQNIAPVKEDIEAIQHQWQAAIERYLLRCARIPGWSKIGWSALEIAHSGSSSTAHANLGSLSPAADQNTEESKTIQNSMVASLNTDCQFLVVYDGSLNDYLMTRIIELLSTLELTDSDVQTAITDLKILLNRHPPRDAIARLRPLINIHGRFELAKRLNDPVRAEVYAFPRAKRYLNTTK